MAAARPASRSASSYSPQRSQAVGLLHHVAGVAAGIGFGVLIEAREFLIFANGRFDLVRAYRRKADSSTASPWPVDEFAGAADVAHRQSQPRDLQRILTGGGSRGLARGLCRMRRCAGVVLPGLRHEVGLI